MYSTDWKIQQSRFEDFLKRAFGLSAAGGGDFYYSDNESFRKYFGKFAKKYKFKGAFDGMMHKWETRGEFWGDHRFFQCSRCCTDYTWDSTETINKLIGLWVMIWLYRRIKFQDVPTVVWKPSLGLEDMGIFYII